MQNNKKQTAATSSTRTTVQDSSDSRQAYKSRDDYFEQKNRKLREKYHLDHESQRKSDIFRNVTIHVDGYTQPGIVELRQMIYEHGGAYEQYFSRRLVTHVIATNLPHSKIREYKSMDERTRTHVVRPEWILDSIRLGAKQPERSYLLLGDSRQGELLLFPTRKAVVPVVTNSDYHHRSDDQVSGVYSDCNDNGEHNETLITTRSEQVSLNSDSNSADDDENMNLTVVSHEIESNQNCDNNRNNNNNNNNSNMLHNAATDPDYVKNFLKNSRLHFIGSWRRRFMERNQLTIQNHCAIRKKLSVRPDASTYFVVHLDMDCFFASIAMRQNPELRTMPIAVSHSGNNAHGEISSANYVARKYGIKAGMWMKRAKELCKDLIIVPYQFHLYEEAALQVYNILREFVPSDSIEVSSIDESYLYMHQICMDENHASSLVSDIRKKIEATTGCTASAGIAHNKLLARMATKKAKPNGQYLVSRSSDLLTFMSSFNVRDLHGIGGKMQGRLQRELGVTTIQDLLSIEKSTLQRVFGTKKGELLYRQCRGEESVQDMLNQDDVWDKKSRTVEVNYGIRFDKVDQVNFFLDKLCQEMSERLSLENILVKCITLKMMKRHPDAPIEPAKFNGHGMCDTFSKSSLMPDYTNNQKVLFQHAKALYEQLGIEPAELRGIGIKVSKIMNKSARYDKTTRRVSQFFQRIGKSDVSERRNDGDDPNDETHGNHVLDDYGNDNGETNDNPADAYNAKIAGPVPYAPKQVPTVNPDSRFNSNHQLPNMSQIDADIFELLPSDIKNELIEAYKTATAANSRLAPAPVQHSISGKQQPRPILGKRKQVAPKFKAVTSDPKQRKLSHFVEQGATVASSGSCSRAKNRTTTEPESSAPPSTQDIARGLYSQVDYRVLKELPTQIQNQVLVDAHQSRKQRQRLTVKPLTLTTAATEQQLQRQGAQVPDIGDRRCVTVAVDGTNAELVQQCAGGTTGDQIGDDGDSNQALFSSSFSDDLSSIREMLRRWIDSFPEIVPSQSSSSSRSPPLLSDDTTSSSDGSSEESNVGEHVHFEMLRDHDQSHLKLELLIQYFDQLINTDGNLELVITLLRFIRRQCASTLCRMSSELSIRHVRWLFNSQILPHVRSMILPRYLSVLPVSPIGSPTKAPNKNTVRLW